MPSPPPGTQAFSVTRFRGRSITQEADTVAEEAPLEIAVRHRGRRRVVAVTMRTPGDDLHLAYGFLFTEGLLPPGQIVEARPRVPGNSVELEWPPELPLDLKSIDRHSYTSSSCGVCGKTSIEQVYQSLPFPDDTRRTRVDAEVLYSLPDRLRQAQELFGHTGGIHAAGLFSPDGSLLHLAEDVGRHNALDKVIGHFYRSDALPLGGTVLMLSGRASFELLQKAAMAGIECVVSVGAPSTLAVELAEDQGITLCGFLRGDSLNCYCHPERIGSVPEQPAPEIPKDPGETDLGKLLADLRPVLRPGRYVFATCPADTVVAEGEVVARIVEPEGLSVVVRPAYARRLGLSHSREYAWIVLEVGSSLEAVGLTATVAAALASVGISCNVVAGNRHDHLFVPAARAQSALEILRGLPTGDEPGPAASV